MSHRLLHLSNNYPTWMNLGHWNNNNNNNNKEQTYVNACENMLVKLFDMCNQHIINFDDKHIRILDVGYGYGDQCLYLINSIMKNATIIGFNISLKQVIQAKKLITQHNMNDRIHLYNGSAVNLYQHLHNLSLPLNFNIIMALDCAYFFNLKHDFFKEAYNILNNNNDNNNNSGILLFTDIVVTEEFFKKRTWFNDIIMRCFCKLCNCPIENIKYPYHHIKKELRLIGFEDVTINSSKKINQAVFGGFSTFVNNQYKNWYDLTSFWPWLKYRITAYLCEKVLINNWLDYIYVMAKTKNGN